MRLDHDSEHVLAELTDLVNGDGRDGGPDVLASLDSLVAFLDAHEISGSRPTTESELRAVRRLRSRLRGVFERAAAGDRDAVVAEINALIAEAKAVPYLIEHDGNPLHLHYTPLDAPVHHRMGAEMAIALAIVVRDGGLERLRVCAAPGCGNVVVDLSRNRSRLYCGAQCANRQHVAAYRRRRASS
ncbi:MAG TPA: CGNR zinc finger domain-containing protein [Acidimicrobiales bacterium]